MARALPHVVILGPDGSLIGLPECGALVIAWTPDVREMRRRLGEAGEIPDSLLEIPEEFPPLSRVRETGTKEKT